jgi:hypothetical protein
MMVEPVNDARAAADALHAALESAGVGDPWVSAPDYGGEAIIDGRFDLRIAALAYLVRAADAGLVSVDPARLAAWREAVDAMRAAAAKDD